MQAGDMVYYRHIDRKRSTEIKFAASILSIGSEGIRIIVGRFDVLSSKLETFESIVSADKLSPRSAPCSFEDDLRTSN